MIGDKITRSIKEQKELFDSLELLGALEVSQLLNWDQQKVHNYTKRRALPEPVGRIGSRPVWTRAQIEKFKKGREQGNA